MASILDGELAETIGQALLDANIPLDCTVTRTETTGEDPFDPGSGTTTTTDYDCKGFADTFEQDVIDGTLIMSSDVKIVVVANTLAIEPSTSDTVTIRGKTYTVANVSTDPAQALWELQGRA